MSAMGADFLLPARGGANDESEDVDMKDIGPTTAPLQGANATFYHDD